jgi:pyruvate formate lyase activating enzyme
VLHALTYGSVVAHAVDPIEKKPLYHVLPGSATFSIATVGCNFTCANCQNHEIAQAQWPSGRGLDDQQTSPEEIVAAAERAHCDSVAYTYTEPTVFLEFALDTARQATASGLLNLFVSNGYMTGQALDAAAPFLSAINIDLKGIRPSFYRDVTGGRLRPVLRTLERCLELGVWVEVTTLVIPGLNDSPQDLQRTAAAIAQRSREIPWHISRFHPAHRLRRIPATPVATLALARDLGREAGLEYVYLGNLPGQGENTTCPNCGSTVIRRYGYRVVENRLRPDRCPDCGREIAGIWTRDAGLPRSAHRPLTGER